MLRLSSWGRVGLVAPGPEGSRSQTGVEPMSPALEDRLLISGPPDLKSEGDVRDQVQFTQL